jgi:hypothetical protein
MPQNNVVTKVLYAITHYERKRLKIFIFARTPSCGESKMTSQGLEYNSKPSKAVAEVIASLTSNFV